MVSDWRPIAEENLTKRHLLTSAEIRSAEAYIRYGTLSAAGRSTGVSIDRVRQHLSKGNSVVRSGLPLTVPQLRYRGRV